MLKRNVRPNSRLILVRSGYLLFSFLKGFASSSCSPSDKYPLLTTAILAAALRKYRFGIGVLNCEKYQKSMQRGAFCALLRDIDRGRGTRATWDERSASRAILSELTAM
jgi:hypothetical protein